MAGDAMDDNPFPKGPGRALTRQAQSRAVDKRFRLQIQLARLSAAAVANAIPGPVKTVSRHSVRYGGRCLAAAAALIFIAFGALYARLLTGPLSFAFVVPELQRQLNAQLNGYSFRVGSAILRLSQGWGLEFRLADVSVTDRNGQELAKAPFAAIDISEPSLLRFSLAASEINLLAPKILVVNTPQRGVSLTVASDGIAQPPAAPSSSARIDGAPRPWSAQAVAGQKGADTQIAPARSEWPFNPAPLLGELFAMLEKRGGASSALERIGLRDAVIYFANQTGVSAWSVADFHIDLDESSSASAIRGELTLRQDDATWRASFRAVNQPQRKLYSLTASIEDIVPRTIWRSVPSVEVLKLVDLPLSGQARFEISHDGDISAADAEIKFGSGQIFAPLDEKHPVSIDNGVLRLGYDRQNDRLLITPFELRWDDSILQIQGAVAHRRDPRSNQSLWTVDLDGRGSTLSVPQFGVAPVKVDAMTVSASYQPSSDTVKLNELRVQAGGGGFAIAGQAESVHAGGPITVNGTVFPTQMSVLKAFWPAFVANGGRDWIGSNIPKGRVTGGTIAINLTAATLAQLDKGGDVPDDAVTVRLGLSGMQIYHIKGLPPILTKDTTVRIAGRRLVFDVPTDGRIDVPSGRAISFSDGQLVIDDLRPHFPDAEIHFKGAGEMTAVLELLDQPPLGYVKAVGFKPSLMNGQVTAGFKITFPLLKDLKFKQMTLGGKTRVTDLRSNGLPGGLNVTGGAVAFDISETAISASGDLKVNNVPVSLAWQRIYDAPPEQQPTLRLAAILSDKARDELGLNINHIVKGDMPLALAVAMQRDGPPKLFMEANLTNTDLFLTAIGWRKPPGQKAGLTFDLLQRPDNSILLDNFIMTGDGININGRLIFNDHKRIAGFSFPEFSNNALTKLAITGELTPQNVLKVRAKGPSFDGRQFFRSLFSAGKLSDNQPAPLKDEPGLDISVEIDTIFGFYEATAKSVVVDGKRRGGKLTYLEAAGRLNGQSPFAVHVDQRGSSDARILVSDATDAGSAFRLIGFYKAVQGGQMNLRVNLDGTGGAEKSGVLDVRNFIIAGDQVVGRVVSQAEREGAKHKADSRGTPQAVSGTEPLQFDRMVIPFAVGPNQFQLYNAAINGPLLGATLRGSIDFNRDTLALSGTYLPLYGFNAVFDAVPLPIISDMLKGRDNEGLFGITFAVQGKTSNPDVVVNPASVFAPGFLRQIFEFENAPSALPPAQVPASAPASSQSRAANPDATRNN
jgi:hypothetical protein